ncbi:hypothetical protein G6F31_015955 [Rhizopus arrhizus]|nr:hypothetical protein G6F31_015955 [Rhizopus arrhizus]
MVPALRGDARCRQHPAEHRAVPVVPQWREPGFHHQHPLFRAPAEEDPQLLPGLQRSRTAGGRRKRAQCPEDRGAARPGGVHSQCTADPADLGHIGSADQPAGGGHRAGLWFCCHHAFGHRHPPRADPS